MQGTVDRGHVTSTVAPKTCERGVPGGVDLSYTTGNPFLGETLYLTRYVQYAFYDGT